MAVYLVTIFVNIYGFAEHKSVVWKCSFWVHIFTDSMQENESKNGTNIKWDLFMLGLFAKFHPDTIWDSSVIPKVLHSLHYLFFREYRSNMLGDKHSVEKFQTVLSFLFVHESMQCKRGITSFPQGSWGLPTGHEQLPIGTQELRPQPLNPFWSSRER